MHTCTIVLIFVSLFVSFFHCSSVAPFRNSFSHIATGRTYLIQLRFLHRNHIQHPALKKRPSSTKKSCYQKRNSYIHDEINRALCLWSSEGLRHALYTVLPTINVHNGHSRYLPSNFVSLDERARCNETHLSNFPFQIHIASGDNVAPMLLASLQQTVIGVSTAVGTWQSFKSGIFRKSQC